MRAWSLGHWTTKEDPVLHFFIPGLHSTQRLVHHPEPSSQCASTSLPPADVSRFDLAPDEGVTGPKMRKVGKKYHGLVSPFSRGSQTVLPKALSPWKSRSRLAGSCSAWKGDCEVLTVRPPQAGCASRGTTGLAPGLISNASLQPVQAVALPPCPDAEPCTRSW